MLYNLIKKYMNKDVMQKIKIIQMLPVELYQPTSILSQLITGAGSHWAKIQIFINETNLNRF